MFLKNIRYATPAMTTITTSITIHHQEKLLCPGTAVVEGIGVGVDVGSGVAVAVGVGEGATVADGDGVAVAVGVTDAMPAPR